MTSDALRTSVILMSTNLPPILHYSPLAFSASTLTLKLSTANLRHRSARILEPTMSSTSDPPTMPSRRDISRTLSATKNLRTISMSLVQKLRTNAGISSVDIAAELATEAISEIEDAATAVSAVELQAVGKNIRRRLYDSLKVLESIGAITRTRKDKTLTWVGTNHLIPQRFQTNQRVEPCNPASERAVLSQSVDRIRKGISSKTAELSQLKAQSHALLNLCRRNQRYPGPEPVRIHMPFVVIRTPVNTEIRLEATPDARSIAFEFHGYYEIVNDASILDRMFLVSDEAIVLDRPQNETLKASDVQHSNGVDRQVEPDPFSSPKRRRVASKSPFAKFTSGAKPPLSPGTPLWQDPLTRKLRVPTYTSPLTRSRHKRTTPSVDNECPSQYESPPRSSMCTPPRKRRFDYGGSNSDNIQDETKHSAGSKPGFLRRTYGPLRRANPEKGTVEYEPLKPRTATSPVPTWQ